MNLRGLFSVVLIAVFSAMSGMSSAEIAADALTREREQQTGTAITILFDNSGSMRGEKIRQAKAAFQAWLQTVPEDYKYSLITFEDRGHLVVPLGEHTRDLVAQKVAKLDANTSTPICGALRIAREQIEKRRREVALYERHVVLIFTDGEENIDGRGIDGVRADIQALRKQTVEVVGVGFHGEGDYMKGVATRFALANDERELKKGLDKVDAEIGGGDDLVISPEDLAALKKFTPAPVTAMTAATPQEGANLSGIAAPAKVRGSDQPKRSFQVWWIVMALLVWLANRGLTGARKAR